MRLVRDTHIDFLRFRKRAFILSIVLIVTGLVSLIIKKGPNLGIDFSGGTLVQLSFEKLQSLDQVRSVLDEEGFLGFGLQRFSKHNSILIRIKKSEKKEEMAGDAIQRIIREKIPDNPFVMERVEFVGPVVGRHLVNRALWAVILSMIFIVIYVGFRFKSGIWGIAGVAALFHDVFIVLGIFSVMNKEITLTVVAAFLTLAGYSVNDTIVIFDRIRENIRLMRKESLYEIMNQSLNGTLSRTVMTSLTTLLAVLALFLFGGEVLHDFAFGLLFGIIVGTYSSIFVATPLVYMWQMRIEKEYMKKK